MTDTQALILADLIAKGELTAADLRNRLRANHGVKLTEAAVASHLRSMRSRRVVKAETLAHRGGRETIWMAA